MVLLTCLLPAVAMAHSFSRYVSTPITPPLEFIWWLPVSCALIVLGSFLIIWRFLGRHWLAAIGLSLVATTLFAIPFFMFGRFAASASTAPPPGLGFPHPTFWGMGWDRAGWLFVRWNLYGYLFLLASLFLCGGIHRTKARFRKLAPLTLMIYAVGLVPYIVTGALVHGSAGGYYVHVGCERRLEILNSALAEYADQHNGQLPKANGIGSILQELKPYIDKEQIRYSIPIDVCPLGGAYEREPKHYEWNTNFSGITLRDVDPDKFFHEVVPFSCPYHQKMGSRAVFTLKERIFDSKYKRTPTTN